MLHLCKSLFHAICENTGDDNKLGTNTVVATFLAPSTKENFKFFCNTCLTKLEMSMTKSNTQKTKFSSMENKLGEMKELQYMIQQGEIRNSQSSCP